MSAPTYRADAYGRESSGPDKTKACCQFRRTVGLYIPGEGPPTEVKSRRHIFETVRCTPQASPRSCCEDRESRTGFSLFRMDKKCTGASWGACCLCTVKVVRRSATMNIAQASNVHHFFQVSCPGDKYQVNFHPADGRSRVAPGSVSGGRVERGEDAAPNLVK